MNALDLASTLTAAGSPFVLATVVRCDKPTSAKPGQKAVILPDGAMHGWVGGSCAQPLVTREALLALADGQPRLMRLHPTAGDGASLPGLVEHRMTCHSGGTLEIFIEPMLPKPALCIVGDSPVASVLANLGPIVGYQVTHIDAAFDGIADRIGAALAGDSGRRSSVIVATMGETDEEALVAALRSDAPYVALVASPRRAEKVREYLSDEGLSCCQIGKLHAPAGLDLGAQSAEDIALSIMAQIVQERAKAAATAPARIPTLASVPESAAAPEPAQPVARKGKPLPVIQPAVAPEAEGVAEGGSAVDPVCEMLVPISGARVTCELEGVTYYFCCPGCRRRFLQSPAEFLDKTNSKSA